VVPDFYALNLHKREIEPTALSQQYFQNGLKNVPLTTLVATPPIPTEFT
jgi:hypothetical protein